MATHSPAADSPSEEAATRLETEGVEACPLCESTATEIWRTDCRDWQQPRMRDRFEYMRCTQCAACFLAVRPLEAELGKVYFAGYGPHQIVPGCGPEHSRVYPAFSRPGPPFRAVGAAVDLLRRRLQRQLDRMYTPEYDGEALLDFGCGAPMFLESARDRGFVTVGADFAEDVVQTARTSGHQAFVVGEEFERNVLAGSLGCVRMNHVIEHLYHPHETLAAIHAKMRSGGRIHISTPNPGSIGSQIFRRHWHALDCPRHVILYRPRVLRSLLFELGFRDISVVHEMGPKDLSRSWGIVLYDRGRIGHEQIGAMATDPIRSALFLPLAGLAVLLSAADRYHVFAHA
jgi:SAM-dependent methyltransferase